MRMQTEFRYREAVVIMPGKDAAPIRAPCTDEAAAGLAAA